MFCAGVLVLHAPCLKKKEQEKLAEALGRSSIALCPDPCLAVPVSAVLWMLTPSCADTLFKVSYNLLASNFLCPCQNLRCNPHIAHAPFICSVMLSPDMQLSYSLADCCCSAETSAGWYQKPIWGSSSPAPAGCL